MNASLPTGYSPKKPHSLLACLCRGLLSALLLMLLFLVAAAAFAYRSDDPTAHLTPLAYTVAFLTAFAVGFFTARRRAGQGLLCGAMAGLLLVAFFAVGYLALRGDDETGMGRMALTYLLLWAVALPGGLLGAANAGRNGVRRVRRTKHR